MRALITNDDGIQSRGIHELARVAIAAGLDVQIAAPETERSGSSAALSALAEGGRLLMEERPLEGLDGVRAHAVQATPAMIAFAATRGAFGARPDVLLSGINHGPNTGTAILHSGTVGAAFTAAAHGVPALAVSFATGRPNNWETASQFAARGLAWFLQHTEDAYVLNVNVPDLPADQCRGLRHGGLAHFGAVQAHVGERGSGYVTITFAEVDELPMPDTDVALLRQGWATATALKAPVETSAVDVSTIS
ncbi:MAG TPA: 5'/3'-nucleotidase SurE [Jatrophihabitans sp.]|nr:5'/3'-nucleotidase SurE [Jatrophihabitans sp.]